MKISIEIKELNVDLRGLGRAAWAVVLLLFH